MYSPAIDGDYHYLTYDKGCPVAEIPALNDVQPRHAQMQQSVLSARAAHVILYESFDRLLHLKCEPHQIINLVTPIGDLQKYSQ